jgi:hypothetical protein
LSAPGVTDQRGDGRLGEQNGAHDLRGTGARSGVSKGIRECEADFRQMRTISLSGKLVNVPL